MNFVSTHPKKTKPPPELKKNQGPNKHKEYRKLCFVNSDRRLTYDPGCGKEFVDRSIDRSLAPPTSTAPEACKPNRVTFSSFFSFARPVAFRVCFGDCPGERFCVKRCGLPYVGLYPAGHTYGHLNIPNQRLWMDSLILVLIFLWKTCNP
jgi:hypothetical protein